jgi:hypothetical protein
MTISEQEKQFAAFILAKSGKQHLLQPIMDRCEKDGITVWKHFEEGLVQQYQHSQPEAQRKVQEWHSEFLAAQQANLAPLAPVDITGKKAEVVIQVSDATVPPPVNGKSRFWLWLLPLILLAGGGAYYFFIRKPAETNSPTTLYVLTEDSLTLRTNMDCDKNRNRKVIGLAYSQPVELAEPIDSSKNWVKVRVPGTQGADGKPLEGYIADYRMLGVRELNTSLDSIYRDRAWNPLLEKLSYPVKKSLYQYIRNSNFEWFVDPVREKDTSGFQTIVDLPYGKEQINKCALTSYVKFRLVILTHRSNGGKKAMIFSLNSNYTSEKIDERDLSGLSDPIVLKTKGDIFITEGRDKEAKKYVIGKNSTNTPMFKEYVAPPLFDFNLFPEEQFPAPDSGVHWEM